MEAKEFNIVSTILRFFLSEINVSVKVVKSLLIEHDLSFVSGWAATRNKSIPALMVARVHAGSLILQCWTVEKKNAVQPKQLECTKETLVTLLLLQTSIYRC